MALMNYHQVVPLSNSDPKLYDNIRRAPLPNLHFPNTIKLWEIISTLHLFLIIECMLHQQNCFGFNTCSFRFPIHFYYFWWLYKLARTLHKFRNAVLDSRGFYRCWNFDRKLQPTLGKINRTLYIWRYYYFLS